MYLYIRIDSYSSRDPNKEVGLWRERGGNFLLSPATA
jgi:hypothetical protein